MSDMGITQKKIRFGDWTCTTEADFFPKQIIFWQEGMKFEVWNSYFHFYVFTNRYVADTNNLMSFSYKKSLFPVYVCLAQQV